MNTKQRYDQSHLRSKCFFDPIYFSSFSSSHLIQPTLFHFIALLLTTLMLNINTVSATSEAAESDLDMEMPVVITPAHMKQPLTHSPTGVTVIKKETIKLLGIRSIPEALRLAPGMIVTYRTGESPIVNFHGNNGIFPSRIQLLIDGASIFNGSYNNVGWAKIPITMDEIERIEIVRGSSAASHGSNAFQAVINIITANPEDIPDGHSTRLTGGSLNTLEAFYNFKNQFNATHYQVSLSKMASDGVDFVDKDETEFRDSAWIERLNWHSKTLIDDRSHLDLHFNFLRNELETNLYETPERNSQADKTQNIDFFSANYHRDINSHHQFESLIYGAKRTTKQEWVICVVPNTLFFDELDQLDKLNPALAIATFEGSAFSGEITPQEQSLIDSYQSHKLNDPLAFYCGEINHNAEDERFDLSFQHTFAAQHLQTVIGYGGTFVRFKSETFVGGSVDESRYHVRINSEYNPNEQLTFNVGAYTETITGENDDLVIFSPKLGINYHLSTYQTLRFSVARGESLPSLIDRERAWTYFFATDSLPNGGDTFFHTARTLNDLEPERIVEQQLGYNLHLPEYNLQLDVTLFNESLDNLISKPSEYFTYAPNNDAAVDLRGVDIEMGVQLTQQLRLQSAYSYLDNDTDFPIEQTLYSQHVGGTQIFYTFNEQQNLTVGYYGNSEILNIDFSRYDITYSQQFKVSGAESLNLDLTLQYYTSSEQLLAGEASNIALYDGSTFYYEHQTQYFITLRANF